MSNFAGLTFKFQQKSNTFKKSWPNVLTEKVQVNIYKSLKCTSENDNLVQRVRGYQDICKYAASRTDS